MNIPESCAVVSLLLLSSLTTPGCNRSAPTPYVPGLGEIMTATQMRHSKLWFAGRAGNWPLASYELDELQEGFEDAVRFHPTHKDAPISDLLPRMTAAPLAQLDRAIAGKDVAEFTRAFDALTAACNACHQAAHFGFNVITRPTSNPFTNQRFEKGQPDSVH
jgi:hypothetical protein